MRKIAIEEHFITEEFLYYLQSRKDCPRWEIVEDGNHNKIEKVWYTQSCFSARSNPDLSNKPICDMGEGRLRVMDEAGIDMQVLSLGTPGVEGFDASDAKIWAQKTNNELAKVVQKYPDRFAGMAALPLQEPDAAADELERAVKSLGFCGANINSHIKGEYLDDRKFWVVFEKAEKLGVPIYIHPREPSPDMVKPYTAHPRLWTALWGFGAEVGLHAMRLICSGVFDEFPRLKIIIGHMGEALPFWMWRIDNKWQNTPMGKKFKKKPSEYVRDNFGITTSGFFSSPALLCACMTVGVDNILFAVDYPYESIDTAIKFMESAPICESDKEKIYHLNAERFLSL